MKHANVNVVSVSLWKQKWLFKVTIVHDKIMEMKRLDASVVVAADEEEESV